MEVNFLFPGINEQFNRALVDTGGIVGPADMKAYGVWRETLLIVFDLVHDGIDRMKKLRIEFVIGVAEHLIAAHPALLSTCPTIEIEVLLFQRGDHRFVKTLLENQLLEQFWNPEVLLPWTVIEQFVSQTHALTDVNLTDWLEYFMERSIESPVAKPQDTQPYTGMQ